MTAVAEALRVSRFNLSERMKGKSSLADHTSKRTMSSCCLPFLVKLEEELALARLHRFAPRNEQDVDRIFNEAEEAADEASSMTFPTIRRLVLAAVGRCSAGRGRYRATFTSK